MTIDPRTLIPQPNDKPATGTNRELEELTPERAPSPQDFGNERTGTNEELPERVEQERNGGGAG